MADKLTAAAMTAGKIIRAFENTGTAAAPVWTREATWDSPAPYRYPHPALGDLTGDGLGLLGEVDDTEAAFAQRLEDLVLADLAKGLTGRVGRIGKAVWRMRHAPALH